MFEYDDPIRYPDKYFGAPEAPYNDYRRSIETWENYPRIIDLREKRHEEEILR
jgi:hypothetical protein